MKSSLLFVLLTASIGLSSACGDSGTLFTGSSATSSGSGGGTGGASTAQSSASTAQSSTSSGSGGAGGAATEQNCVNGLDDDGDGLADCADPDCSSFACVPAPPAGWVGVAWLDPSAPPGLCPPDLAQQIDLFNPADLKAPPASCSCACGAAVGVACGTHLRCDTTAGLCAAMGPANGQSASCGSNIPNVNFPAYCRADPPGAFGGACVPSAAGAPAPWSWMLAQRACASQVSGACKDPASVCVAKLAGGIGPCITQAGDLACPAPYGKKTLYYDGKTVTDDRACDGSACTCAAPIGSTCDCGVVGCAVELYGDGVCGAQQTSVSTNAVCGLVQTKPSSAKVVGATPVAGACPPAGAAQAKGAVTPTAPVTVCCVP